MRKALTQCEQASVKTPNKPKINPHSNATKKLYPYGISLPVNMPLYFYFLFLC